MVDMEDAHTREATLADKEAVLKIRDDVCGGRDFLPALYDTFISSAHITSFVVLYKSNVVAFASATLLDGGDTVMVRALRVCKQYEGAGFSRLSREHIDTWTKKMHVHRTVTVVTEDYMAVVTKPLFSDDNKHILTKDVLQYHVESQSLKLLEPDVRLAQGLTIVSDSLLAHYICSETISQYLFPKGRIVVNSLPYKVMESNIPLLREHKDATIIFCDVKLHFNSPKGVLSIGTMCPVPKPAYAYNIELYGSDYGSVRNHIARHMIRLKEKTPDLTSVFVFVDECFPFQVVDNVFSDYGSNRDSTRDFTKRLVFEKFLEPSSRY